MELLILGGTRFLGRHLARLAIDAGHEVTLLHRGRSASGLFPEAEHRIADRDQEGEFAAALAGGGWDAVIDTSAYLPRQVASAAASLAGRVGQYQLVSSISVYADFDAAATAEEALLQSLPDPRVQVVDGTTYGGLKALCEGAAHEGFGDGCLVSRPGLLVGPHDPTGRFTWWAQRFVRADSGDDDEAEVLAPGDPDAPVQCIDARDAAAWMLHQAEAGHRGTYNLTGPETPTTMGELLETARRTLAPEAQVLWVDETFLLGQGVAPWSDLPVWLPLAQSGVHRIDITRALDTGLQCRPLAQTLADTAAWAATSPPPVPGGPLRPPVGLAPEREAALRAAWRAR
ncbi:MAG: NAD-dependent epimerase/dehydratase family protein [Rubrivivax sp.]|nr:NAD-dependent epimerase/dehydratase family protein [Rubrivivax sp.]